MRNALMFGAGGWAEGWLTWLLPKFSGQCRVTGIVDVDEVALRRRGTELGLWPNSCFTSIGAALDAVRRGWVAADVAFVVFPPEHHREAVVGSMSLGLDVLCE